MVARHVTPGGWRRRAALIAVLVLVLAAVIAAWWLLRPSLPQARAAELLGDAPVLGLPAAPAGMVVLADPGGWARLLAKDPARRLLLDPAWWNGLATRQGRAAGAVAPAAVAAGVLSQFPRGLVAAWWADGWVVQGRPRGGAVVGGMGAEGLLPAGVEGRVVVKDGVLRLASSPALLDGWGWRPPTAGAVPAADRLACWALVAGREWRGRWAAERTLELVAGTPPAPPPASPGGALVAGAGDALAALANADVRIPEDGLIGAVGREVTRSLRRPATVWLQEVAPAQPLPRPRGAVLLGWRGDEPAGAARERAVGVIRNALCPFGCRETEVEGEPGVTRWRSPLLSWWVRVDDGGVLLATGQRQLAAANGLVAPAVAHGWFEARGPALAAAARVLADATLLAQVGVLPRGRLEQLRQAAGPLAGFDRIEWSEGAGGAMARIGFGTPEPAPTPEQ